MQETWIRSLCQEDPLEKKMAIPPIFLSGKSHGQRSLVGYSLWGCKRVGHDLAPKQRNWFILGCLLSDSNIEIR